MGRGRHSLSLATVIVLILGTMLAFFRLVIRDRKALMESPHVAAVAGTSAPPESVNTSEAVFRKASPSVVTVKVFNRADNRLSMQGSGMVVAPQTVATNRHVVESGGEIRVVDRGQEYAASVTHADREYDLCALSVPGLQADPVEMASFLTLSVGQHVYAIGSPRGLELSISDGLVSAIRPYGAFPLIQTNAPISKGSSGGGLFDTDGRLVGITTASAIDGQNINFALVSDLISQLPARSADIRTLKPVVPPKRTDEIHNKELLDSLEEGRKAIAASESERKAMAEEIGRHTFAIEELKRSMDGFLSSRNAKAYNDMVPRHNRLIGDRANLATRFEQKHQTHQSLVEQYNRLAERYNNQGRLKP